MQMISCYLLTLLMHLLTELSIYRHRDVSIPGDGVKLPRRVCKGKGHPFLCFFY